MYISFGRKKIIPDLRPSVQFWNLEWIGITLRLLGLKKQDRAGSDGNKRRKERQIRVKTLLRRRDKKAVILNEEQSLYS